MGQLILNDEIDYEAVKEHIEKRIRAYIGDWAYGCYPKEYRQSDEWQDKNLADKLAHILRDSKDIDNFIEYLIDKE